MKEIHAILFLSGAEAFAQDARQLIEENPLRAAGALHAYEPLDTLFSAAPKGYEPFYISHFGRHGSRYHSSEKKFSVIETLKAYKGKGLLTPEVDPASPFPSNLKSQVPSKERRSWAKSPEQKSNRPRRRLEYFIALLGQAKDR